MIIGVDHIAMSCLSFDRSVNFFHDAGYSIKFINSNVPNPQAKTPFLYKYNNLHSVAFCQSAKGLPIELIQHGKAFAVSVGAFLPVFTHLPKDAQLLRDDMWNIEGMKQKFCQFRGSSTIAMVEADVLEDETSLYITQVVLPCNDLNASRNFWNKIGFRTIGDSGKANELLFTAPIPQWNLKLHLVETDNPNNSMLDSQGFPCLALLSTQINEDLLQLTQNGINEFLGPFEIRIDGKDLQLAMLRGPDKEIVELIQFSH